MLWDLNQELFFIWNTVILCTTESLINGFYLYKYMCMSLGYTVTIA